MKPVAAAETPAAPSNAGARPSAVKPASASADLTFYKAVQQKEAEAPAAEVTCIACGATIAPSLARLGSMHCHDCRDGLATTPYAGVAAA